MGRGWTGFCGGALSIAVWLTSAVCGFGASDSDTSDRLASARAQLAREIDAGPRSAEFYAGLLRRMADARVMQAAADHFRSRLVRHPEDGLAQFGMGEALRLQAIESRDVAQYEQASNHLQSALDVFPGVAEIRRSLAQTLIGAHDPDGALDTLEPLLEADDGSTAAIDAEAHKLAARAYLRLREPRVAEFHLREVLSTVPRDVDVRLELAEILRRAGRYDAAAAELGVALRHRNRSPEIYYALGKIYAHKDMPDKAVDMYRRARRHDPDNPEARYELASIFLAADNGRYAVLSARSALAADGRYKSEVDALRDASIVDAADILSDAARRVPGNASLHAFQGELYLKLGDRQAAREHIERAKELDPENASIRSSLARLLLAHSPPADLLNATASSVGSTEPSVYAPLAQVDKKEGALQRFVDATSELLAMTSADPLLEAQLGDALLALAAQAREAGDDELRRAHLRDAGRAYRRAVDEVPNNPAWTFRLARIYDDLGMLKAIRLYQEAAKLDPRNAHIFHRWGVFLLNFRMRSQGAATLYDPADAVAHLERAVSLDQTIGGAYYALGIAYKREKDTDRAVRALERADELGFMVDEGMLFLAVHYSDGGDVAKALAVFDRARELLPDDVEVLKDFSFLALKHGGATYRSRAIASLRKVVDLAPDDSEALMNYGFVLHDTGRSTEAAEYLSRAAALDPESRLIRYNLALALDGAGRREKALEAWSTVLGMDPDGPYAVAAQERIAYLNGP